MNPILIDTNAYAAFKRGDASALQILQSAPVLVFNVVVLAELFGGFAVGTREAKNRQELADFISRGQVHVLPIDSSTSEHYARIYAQLRAAGTPIPANDLWIAASALQHSLSLFTFDRHFQAVQGLKSGCTLIELK